MRLGRPVRRSWVVRLALILSLMLTAMAVSVLAFTPGPVAEARPSATAAPITASPARLTPSQAGRTPVSASTNTSADSVPVVKPLRIPVEEEPRPTREVTRRPAATVVFPAPILPPDWDQVARSADVPILMYHYISAAPSPTDKLRVGLSVAPDVFEAQMKLLAESGFSSVTLFDLYDHLATGKPLPDKPVILSFDDGYRDNYENAFPILQKYGLRGTFFVLTAPADAADPAYLTWPMIKTMSDAGMDIQLHAKDHVDLRQRNYDYLVWEIIGGRESIEGHTGKPVVFMSYPSGKYDDAVLQFLQKHNFWAAVTTQPGSRHTLTNALIWPRVRISGQTSLTGFAKAMGISLP